MNKMRRVTYYTYCTLSLFFTAFLLTSCTNVKRHDISDNELYKQFIGSVYKTRNKMVIYGVKLDPTIEKIDFYEISALPGIGGPEIVQLGYLPKGAHLKISKIIERYPSLFLGQSILYIAELMGQPRFKGMEVSVYSAFGTYSKSYDGSFYFLSTEHFEKVE